MYLPAFSKTLSLACNIMFNTNYLTLIVLFQKKSISLPGWAFLVKPAPNPSEIPVTLIMVDGTVCTGAKWSIRPTDFLCP